MTDAAHFAVRQHTWRVLNNVTRHTWSIAVNAIPTVVDDILNSYPQ